MKLKTYRLKLPIDIDMTLYVTQSLSPCPVCGGRELVCWVVDERLTMPLTPNHTLARGAWPMDVWNTPPWGSGGLGVCVTECWKCNTVFS